MATLDDHPMTFREVAAFVAAGNPVPDCVLALPPRHRAMIAAELAGLFEERRRVARGRQREQSRAVRRATPVLTREPCAVCCKYRAITEQHHVRPVASQPPGSSPDTRTVWLCPNCHAILHAFVNGAEATAEFADMLTADQWKAMTPLFLAAKGYQ